MAADRRLGAPGHAGYLSVGHSLEVMKDDHHALRERQREQRVGDRVDGEVPLGLGRGFRGRVGDVRQEVERAGCPGLG